MATDPAPRTDRPPLDAAALERALVRPGGLWRRVRVVPEAGSTNTDLVGAAQGGAPGGIVLVTEHQTAGRGRLDRAFHTPPRAALTFSVLLRPDVPSARLGWLPLLMGAAAVAGVAAASGVRARLKWPNDVLAGGDGGAERKLAGILAEAAFSAEGPGVVIGMGLNVDQDRAELPVPTATSLALEGGGRDRAALLRAVLDAFADRYTAWHGAGGDADACGLAAEYRERCATIGLGVRVHLPGGRLLEGTAADVDAQGRLVVRGPGGTGEAVSAGDVVHVRRADGAY
jgi:BirA family biotin operon repressor/biotin-[acetyl-CoA-carboxylase] ligase